MDLRDTKGICQLTVEPRSAAAFRAASKCRTEYLISASGKVRKRPPGMANPAIASGAYELVATSLTILASPSAPPIQVAEAKNIGEETRLRHRIFDLRRPEVAAKLKARAAASNFVRNFLTAREFIEVETPLLTRATPEGARDYLVPSRLQKGHFYALPQSPQLFKQMLMAAGIDRYYQLPKCFRDEDLRADRQPEFTQIDIEMAFAEERDIMVLAEAMVADLYRRLAGIELARFPIFTYQKAAELYATDRPDLRNPLALTTVTELVAGSGFEVFAREIQAGNRVAALKVPAKGRLSRAVIDRYGQMVVALGGGGLAWLVVEELAPKLKVRSPIGKHLGPDIVGAIVAKLGLEAGDAVFFAAEREASLAKITPPLMAAIAADLDLMALGPKPLWVVDFPLFEDDGQGGLKSVHHPFTAPLFGPRSTPLALPQHLFQAGGKALPKASGGGDSPPPPLDLERFDFGRVASRSYDMVIDGKEVGGGSIRIHQPGVQLAVLQALGFSEAEARAKFGFLLDTLAQGCPPHGGIAFWL